MAASYSFRPVCDLCEVCDLRPWHCEGCSKNLCRKCKQDHINNATCLYHRILPIAREDGESTSRDDDSSDSHDDVIHGAKRFCETHGDEELRRYCATCGTVLCDKCWNGEHSDHKEMNVKNAAFEARKNLNSDILPRMKTELERLKASVDALRKDKAEYMADTKEVLLEVNDKAKLLHTTVEAVQNKLITEISQVEEQEMKKVGRRETEILEKMAEITKFLQTCEGNLGKFDPVSLLAYNSIAEQILQMEKDIFTPPPTVEPPRLNAPKPISRHSLAKFFGQVDLGSTSHEPMANPTIYNDLHNVSDDGMDVIVEKVVCFSLSDNQAAYCVRTLPDGNAWIGTGKQSARLVDCFGGLIKEHRLDFYPYNMTVMKNGHLLLPKESSIQQLAPDGAISTFYTASPYFVQGVCTTLSGHILACLTQRDHGKIIKLNEKAEVTKEYQFDENGKTIFVNPTKIAENPITGDICVEDSARSAVVAVDNTGNRRFTYHGNPCESFSPFYVACDCHGNVLIGDNSHFRIHLLNKDGHFLRFLLTQEDGLFSPWGMDEREGCLWVGTLSGKIWLVHYTMQDECLR